MKKNLKLSVMAIIAIMLSESVFSIKTAPASKEKAVKLIDYIWYKDVELTDPTGTVCSVNNELARLRLLYPYDTFGTTWTVDMHEFEYGLYNQTTVIIYSDR